MSVLFLFFVELYIHWFIVVNAYNIVMRLHVCMHYPLHFHHIESCLFSYHIVV